MSTVDLILASYAATVVLVAIGALRWHATHEHVCEALDDEWSTEIADPSAGVHGGQDIVMSWVIGICWPVVAAGWLLIRAHRLLVAAVTPRGDT